MKDEIRIFLTSPLAFAGSWSANDRTIAVLAAKSDGVRVNGKLESPVGPLIGWGNAARQRTRYYYGSSSSGNFTSREIENVKIDGDVISLKICKVKAMRYSPQTHYYNHDATEFARLAYHDQRNSAFLESIPGLQEQFKNFVDDTFQWWVHTEETRELWRTPPRNNGREPNTFISKNDSAKAANLVDITDLLNNENMATLEGQLQAIIEIATDPKDKLNEYTLETYSKLGMKNGPKSTFLYQRRNHNPGQQALEIDFNEDFNLVPAPETSMKIQSWVSNDQNKVANEPVNLLSQTPSAHTDFTVNFEVSPSNNYKVYALFAWKKVKYVHEKTVRKSRRNNWQGRRTTQYTRNSESRTIYLPVIDSLCLEILPEDLGSLGKKKHYEDISSMYSWDNQRNSLAFRPGSPFYIENLNRVRDATKKRASKGGYRGGYQGISKLSVGDNTLLKQVNLSTFSDIAGADAIKSYAKVMKDQKRTIPLTLEQYMGIERPEIDIKPVEIGHLNFYRLSNPPKRLVVGETLSDLLLPSMPALLISVDTDLSVTNGESYTSGANCSGDCQKEEKIDNILRPGLYLVERKTKCALGHDPGRLEYNHGFGDICNEIITIRNMLSQLNVAYDEYRGNMVGTSNSNKFATTQMDSGAFLGRLG